MALDANDITLIRETIVSAIEELMLPRLDEHDKRFDEHDRRFDVLEKDASELKQDMREVKSSLFRLEGRVEALEADVKEIYLMLADVQKASTSDNKFAKLSLEQKLLKLNAELLAAAKEAGIALPR